MKARFSFAFPVGLLAVLAVAGCGGSSGSSSSTSAPSASAGTTASSGAGGSATVDVASNPQLGKILVDSKGLTLYTFAKDTGGKSMCNGACAQGWPPLMASGQPTGGSGVNAGMLGTVKRSDGSTQATYGGHPLYTFVNDTSPGQTTGNGSTAFGGVWKVVPSSGAKAPTGGSSGGGSSSGGGGGGGSSYGY